MLTTFLGLDQPCDGTPHASIPITLSTAPAQTLMLYLPMSGDTSASVFDDDLGCTTAGKGRLVYRSGDHDHDHAGTGRGRRGRRGHPHLHRLDRSWCAMCTSPGTSREQNGRSWALTLLPVWLLLPL